jgi:type II secretory pathway component PulF
MPYETYDFQALDEAGKIVKDIIAAESKALAIESLRSQGFSPITVKPRGAIFKVAELFARRPKQRLIMFRSLAQLTRAGVSPDDALEIIIRQVRAEIADAKKFRLRRTKGLEKFLRSVVGIKNDYANNGIPLSSGMARRPSEFSPVEAAMVEAGEATGELTAVFEQIAKFLELDRKTSKQLRDALNYPIFVVLAAIAVMAFIFIKVIPSFADFYKGLNVPLPSIMHFLLDTDAIIANPLIDLGVLGGIGAVLFVLVRALGTPAGALQFDKLRMRLPLLGSFFSKAILVRMCRIMAMLLRSAKLHGEVLQITAPVIGSPVYALKLAKVRQLLDDGIVANLFEAFQKSGEFDAQLVGLMEVGVRTGDYAEPILSVADWYEEDVASTAATLPTILQFVVTIVLGGVVAVVVGAVYIPLADLSSNVH